MWNVDLDTFLVVDTLHWIICLGKPTVGDNYPRETHWFSHRFCGFRWIFFKGQLKPGWHLKPLGLFSPQNMRFYWIFSFQLILGFQDMWTVFRTLVGWWLSLGYPMSPELSGSFLEFTFLTFYFHLCSPTVEYLMKWGNAGFEQCLGSLAHIRPYWMVMVPVSSIHKE